MALYSDLTSSIIKQIELFRQAHFPAASYVDWDEHADISTLPQGDLCGPAGIGFTQEDAKLTVAFSYGLATVDDQHLFRLRQKMGLLHSQFQPQTKIPLFNSAGNPIGSNITIITPVTVAPISKAQVRTLQFLTLMGLVDFGALTTN